MIYLPNIISKMPTYNRIKAVLALKRVKNDQLAEALGVTPGAVSTWCRNFKQPSIEKLYEIARFLNVEATALLNPVSEVDE
ncbi:helix-turn-helix transcriptional regulator [Chitinophaga ginsengisegetis]|uniref:helix-turn-helix transcriptional regulator n=2 Tax=Chitinophaga ginsengisegetis TaxID=393003 RepID=UPI00286A88A6|nr:helix-turn-helix transcriptional regulator [Chitinophaga ginsengisegetis]